MNDKKILNYEVLVKTKTEILSNVEEQKLLEIIDWLIKQTKKVNKYREALKFYADESIYYSKNKQRAEITLDYGEKARKVLEDKE